MTWQCVGIVHSLVNAQTALEGNTLPSSKKKVFLQSDDKHNSSLSIDEWLPSPPGHLTAFFLTTHSKHTVHISGLSFLR